MPWLRGRRRCAWLAVAALCALALIGCAPNAAAPTPTPFLAPPTPTVIPTVVVGLQVQDTRVPVLPKRHVRPTPRPRPTHIPAGPYLQLIPTSGPPISRTVWVKGGHLQPSVQVQLFWSPGGHASPVGTTTYTDRKGNLWTRFTVPGSPPGEYGVVAEIGGVRWAAARYRVTNAAHMTVEAIPGGRTEVLQVTGRKFLPDVSLLMVAYALVRPRHPMIIGTIHTDSRGRFQFTYSSRKLVPGQYILQAWSQSEFSAQMAQELFQVVV